MAYLGKGYYEADKFKKYEFTASQGQFQFSVNTIFEVGKVVVYVNGFLIPENEYTISDFATYFNITLDETLNSGDILTVLVFGDIDNYNLAIGIANYSQEFTSNSSQNTFTVTYATDISTYNNSVYVNGNKLLSSHYNVSGNTVTLTNTSILTTNNEIIVESLISDRVVPQSYMVNTSFTSVGTTGISVAVINGTDLEIRKVRGSDNITVSLTGNNEVQVDFTIPLVENENFVANGSVSYFDLNRSPYSQASLIVSVDGIMQTPGVHYSVNATSIIFGSAPPNSSVVSVTHLTGLANTDYVTVTDGAISTSKIQNDAVTPSKLSSAWEEKNVNFNAVSKYKYVITSNSTIIVTLPSGPSLGDHITFVDGTTADHEFFVLPYSGDTIDGKTALLVQSQRYNFDVIYNGTEWQTINLNKGWATISSAYTLYNFGKYFVDTSSSTFSIYLPGTPHVGEEIIFHDISDTWDTNNLTLDGNGKNINGANTYICDVESSTVTIVYNGTQWKVLST